jgi:hypothetical protein
MAWTSGIISDLRLETVCESAKCPNRSECWSSKTATFMIGGNVCTRPCGFCAVPKGKTEALEIDEPERVAEAAARLGLRYVVITSVTRDDLPDGGAEHWYSTILAVRKRTGAKSKCLRRTFVAIETPLLVSSPPNRTSSITTLKLSRDCITAFAATLTTSERWIFCNRFAKKLRTSPPKVA